MSSYLYCPECNSYLEGGDGENHDCSCGWKQPIQNNDDDLHYLKAEIERLRLAAIQAKRFITCYHWKDNPPSSGNWDVSGAGEVYEQLKEALTPES